LGMSPRSVSMFGRCSARCRWPGAMWRPSTRSMPSCAAAGTTAIGGIGSAAPASDAAADSPYLKIAKDLRGDRAARAANGRGRLGGTRRFGLRLPLRVALRAVLGRALSITRRGDNLLVRDPRSTVGPGQTGATPSMMKRWFCRLRCRWARLSISFIRHRGGHHDTRCDHREPFRDCDRWT
jgi:hypothetical protein